MIRDADTMDRPIERDRRRWWWIAAAAGVVAVAVVLAVPSVDRWMRTETSIDGSKVRIGEVTRGDLVREVSADGRIVAAFHPTVFSPAQGMVTVVVRAGEVVEQGQTLARVESPEIASQLQQERATLDALASDHGRLELSTRQRQLENEQGVELAEVRLGAAQRGLKRAQRLFDLGLLNEIELETARDEVTVRSLELDQARQRVELEREMLVFELEDSRLRLDRQRLVVAELDRRVEALTVRSPVAGLVSRLQVEDRQAVGRDAPLVTVVDLSAFEVEIAVAENLADEVAAGTEAVVTVGTTEYAGEVRSIAPTVEGSRVFGRVAFTAEVPDGLKQNQRVSARLLLESRHDVVKVARGPWLESGGGRQAYVVDDRMAAQRGVEVGAISVSEVEVLSGLEPGERIILSDTTRFEGARRVLLR